MIIGSYKSKKVHSLFNRYVRRTIFGILCLGFFSVLAMVLVFLSASSDANGFLTDFALRTPKVATRVLDRHGSIIGSFAEENRIVIPFEDIPQAFIYAVIATEDANFMQHNGVSLRGIARAGFNFVTSLGRRREGASTLTMQLVRVVTAERRRCLTRKLKEMILARKLETRYDKKQILERYANEVYFGGGCYGIEVAAQFYFGKKASQLNIDECALLAGLIQNPNGYNPYSHNAKTKLDTKARRDHVLKRMVDEGYLSNHDFKFFIDQPIKLIRSNARDKNIAPYAVEEVRKYLYAKYGRSLVLEGGLEITTTIDASWQIAAENAVRLGLQAADKLRSFRFDRLHSFSNPDTVQLLDWNRVFVKGDIVQGVILNHQPGFAEVRIGDNKIMVPDAAFSWAGEHVTSLIRRGNAPFFVVKSVGENGVNELELYQEPDLEGALLAIEPQTGEIRAMVGGYDFNRSKFNRALQAERQVGSLMKAFVYGAAFDQGKTPACIVEDVPTEFIFGTTHYKPNNYERSFWGPMPIWEAIRDSRNLPAVRTLNNVGIGNVIDFAYNSGVDKKIIPYPSLALGASDLTLKDMVRSYGTFANSGLRTPQPYLIKKIIDRHGNILENYENQPGTQAIDPISNYHIVQCLRGVAQSGTGARSNSLKWPLAGKTGTTDDCTDAWYVGFSTRIVCGVWVGLDVKKTIFAGGDGSKVALPIWIDFMRTALSSTPKEEFPVPVVMEWHEIDTYTGMIASDFTKGTNRVRLAFKPGTAPDRFSNKNLIDFMQKSKNNARYRPVQYIYWGH